MTARGFHPELVAIGAAIASNCDPCFKFHYDQARKLGVSREDMWRAVTTAQNIKDAPAKAVLDLSDRYLRRETPERAPTPIMLKAAASRCCAPATSKSTDAGAVNKRGRCC